MKSPRNPRPYLRDILDSIEQDAVIRRIEIMGEAVAYLPDDLKERRVLDSP